MRGNVSSHLTSGWLAHVVAATCVALVLIVVGAPRPLPELSANQERGVEELAALLAAPRPERSRIEANVRSWSRFPPEGDSGIALSAALASCSLSTLTEAQRLDLARRLYAITNGSDVTDAELAGTVIAFRLAASEARCGTVPVERLVTAVQRVARDDPRPRADWW